MYGEPFKVLVPTGHPWQKKKLIDPRQLSSEKVLLPHAGHCFRQQVVAACPELSRSDAEGWQGNSLETIRQMVASGLGITVLPASALILKYESNRLIAIEIARPVPGRRIGFAWRRGFTRPRVIDVIREAVHALNIPGLTMVANELLRHGADRHLATPVPKSTSVWTLVHQQQKRLHHAVRNPHSWWYNYREQVTFA